jgi:phospholipase A-2-activating protein
MTSSAIEEIALIPWSSSQGSTEAGQVVGAALSSGRKKMHDGKEYDHVFDVDIADEEPVLKLPYNTTQNLYEAAANFLQDSELPIAYLMRQQTFL